MSAHRSLGIRSACVEIRQRSVTVSLVHAPLHSAVTQPPATNNEQLCDKLARLTAAVLTEQLFI